MGPHAARRPRPAGRRAALGVATTAVLASGAAGALVVGGAAPAAAAPAVARAAAACSTPSPTAAGAGSSAAAVKRVARRVGTTTTKAPKIASPSSRAPKRLVRTDVVRCSGARASTGDTVEVRYSLVLWGGRRKVVDTTWGRAGSASFQLDTSQLIKGFVSGIRGMRVGSRRMIVVPPSQGYGRQATPGVPANSTLIFVVDLVKVG